MDSDRTGTRTEESGGASFPPPRPARPLSRPTLSRPEDAQQSSWPEFGRDGGRGTPEESLGDALADVRAELDALRADLQRTRAILATEDVQPGSAAMSKEQGARLENAVRDLREIVLDRLEAQHTVVRSRLAEVSAQLQSGVAASRTTQERLAALVGAPLPEAAGEDDSDEDSGVCEVDESARPPEADSEGEDASAGTATGAAPRPIDSPSPQAPPAAAGPENGRQAAGEQSPLPPARRGGLRGLLTRR